MARIEACLRRDGQKGRQWGWCGGGGDVALFVCTNNNGEEDKTFSVSIGHLVK